jgi:hypothetical protein
VAAGRLPPSPDPRPRAAGVRRGGPLERPQPGGLHLARGPSGGAVV